MSENETHGSHDTTGAVVGPDDEHGLGPHDGPHGYASDKEAYLKRMRRIEGQVRGIAKMIDKDAYCIDVLTQVSAVTKALQAVSLALVEDHIGHCVVDAAKAGDDDGAAAKVREASEAIGRLVRM
ncbi:metal-sensitive transcriptional regulator [Myceligenerans xiligouense]|uniref:DNA-binding FrmR family transcriptional regulator n=1 Tax=Myceligenerans xiligouense TaxID=253184 RepID=A0A3N4YUX8_9MICO|nr:metal-sensitive transcriptional regulator [Myceligenerans xiligouense]RPF23276.1 DNA-binding FrmR family transcriptional regulator [Myceligenerans xiligouense]